MKRKNWSEFNKEERLYIAERDNNRCIFCGNNNYLQIAHIFLSRAQGGKGSRENGVLLCIRCHRILDNPLGNNQNKQSKKIKKYCEDYLIKKENININTIIEELPFKK